MSRPDYEKQRQDLSRGFAHTKGLDKLNRPERLKRRFDRTPITTKPKGWGWA